MVFGWFLDGFWMVFGWFWMVVFKWFWVGFSSNFGHHEREKKNVAQALLAGLSIHEAQGIGSQTQPSSNKAQEILAGLSIPEALKLIVLVLKLFLVLFDRLRVLNLDVPLGGLVPLKG